eukprot:GHVH01015051.1.p1 GENE.GHVH01015051.1~~GHVH01015051.1.p1  ORF type:complete len:430 (-),score=40.15 GHVH01015051.1:43-1242(-)
MAFPEGQSIPTHFGENDDSPRSYRSKQWRMIPRSPFGVRPCKASSENAPTYKLLERDQEIFNGIFYHSRLGGSANSREVWLCTNKFGQKLVVKAVKKENLDDEVELQLAKLKHSNIVRILRVSKAGSERCSFMEFYEGGDLFYHLNPNGKPKLVLTESEARVFMKQCLSAVRCMHRQGIIHRDLKPSNLLLSKDRSQIYVNDFRSAMLQGKRHLETDVVGTELYMAPEVLKRKYGPQCDIWSLGAILFEMLTPYPLLNSPENKTYSNYKIYEAYLEYLRTCKDQFFDVVDRIARINEFRARHSLPPIELSPAIVDLLQKMLTVNPDERINADDCLEHQWITGEEDPQEERGPSRKMVIIIIITILFLFFLYVIVNLGIPGKRTLEKKQVPQESVITADH